MGLKSFFTLIGFVTVTLVSCKKDDPPVVVANYLFATPNAVTMVAGTDTTVSLSGGVPTYIIVHEPKVNVATASLDGSTVTIHGNGAGGSSVTMGDNATPQNTATVSIVVTVSFIHP
ncbi:MAG: hypothetical protein HYR76_07670 [Ignavibacteria bacterium]|nr:hypothetical protein [Ignavibacteria bacterium]